MKSNSSICIPGIHGKCGGLPVFLGIAPASTLCAHSFADALDEDTGQGYQRKRNIPHSRNFKTYIEQDGTSTIALTFNLRGEHGKQWSLEDTSEGSPFCMLRIENGSQPLAQVDCQHRLGELEHSGIPLAFMAFVGLDLRTEMALFNIINTKAKGLTSSLTDYLESNLIEDLAKDAPHLYIARRLSEDELSPWYRAVRYGGETTSGLKRRVSLRMMQNSVKKFLRATEDLSLGDIEAKYAIIRTFWLAIRNLFPEEWNAPRQHLLTKGVGLYSLTYLLADIARAYEHEPLTEPDTFVRFLDPIKVAVDWSSTGPFANAGGQKGAHGVYEQLKEMMAL